MRLELGLLKRFQGVSTYEEFSRSCLLDAHRRLMLGSRLLLQIVVPFLWIMMVRASVLYDGLILSLTFRRVQGVHDAIHGLLAQEF